MNNKITAIIYYYIGKLNPTVYIKLGNTIRLPARIQEPNFKWIYFKSKDLANESWGRDNKLTGDFWLGIKLVTNKKPIYPKDIDADPTYSFNLFDRNEIKGSGTSSYMEMGEVYQIEGYLGDLLNHIDISEKLINKLRNWIEYD